MPEPRTITAAEAIREAQDVALATDAAVCVIGEGVADPKGVFGTTVGLVNSHGPSRVIEMPLAENAFTGMAIGAAMMGQRPIVVHQRVEFSLLAMEQMVNSAAKLHYVSGGAHRVPLVIRLVVGRGWGQGPQHSQSLEAMFATVPGLKVIAPALPADAEGNRAGDDGHAGQHPGCRVEQVHGTAAPAAASRCLAAKLGDHRIEIAPLGEIVAVATVRADDLVARAQRRAGADGGGLLADGEMHRAAHLLLGIALGDGLLDGADAQHGPVEAEEPRRVRAWRIAGRGGGRGHAGGHRRFALCICLMLK